MADVPPTNATASLHASVDPPRRAARVEISVDYSVLRAVSISAIAALFTALAVNEPLVLLLTMFLGTSPPLAATVKNIAFALSAVAGVATSGLWIWWHRVNADVTFTKARLRGDLNTNKPIPCPSCQVPLILGQVVCAGCGQDLRAAGHPGLPSLFLRRQMLLSHLLETVLVANVTFLWAIVVFGILLAWIQPRPFPQLVPAAYACSYAASSIVIALRVPRAILLWRLFQAEKLESGS